MTKTQMMIVEECDALKEMLLLKNRAYGDSAIHPIRVLSKADPVEQLKVRADDKLNRLMKGDGTGGEDAELDLMGYLILMRVARRVYAGAALDSGGSGA